MYLRQFEYVITVADEKSFSKAARKLFISQPSLSQNIQSIEQQLGIQLFNRTTTPLSLTYAGEQFVDTARHILELNDRLLRQIRDIDELKEGSLSIGIPVLRGSHILPGVLPVFAEKFPGIKINLVEETSVLLEELTVKGKTDFTIISLPVLSDQLEFETLFTEEILVAIPKSYLPRLSLKDGQYQQGKACLPLSGLQDEPFILLKHGQRLRSTTDELFSKAGFKPNIKLECKDFQTVINLVAAGMGVSFIPDSAARFGLVPSTIACFSIEETAIWSIAITYHKGQVLSKAALKFIELMKETLSERRINGSTRVI